MLRLDSSRVAIQCLQLSIALWLPSTVAAHSGQSVTAPFASLAPRFDAAGKFPKGCNIFAPDGYKDAVPISIDSGVIVYVEHTDADIFFCFSGVQTRSVAPLTPPDPRTLVSVYLDPDHLGSASDLGSRYLFEIRPSGPVGATGIALTAAGDPIPVIHTLPSVPPATSSSNAADSAAGEFLVAWNAEIRISKALLMGYLPCPIKRVVGSCGISNWRTVGLRLAYHDGATGHSASWPSASAAENPGGWGDLIFAASSSGKLGGVLTNLNNNPRTGDYFEAALNPATVNASTLASFGKLHTWEVDGQLYAQPLYVSGLTLPDGRVHNVVYAATQKNFVYAFDADSFAQLWGVQLGNPVLAQEVDCQNNITPFVGITSTPVISIPQSTVYVVAKSKEAGRYFYRLHALDLATGNERPGSPIEIGASVPGSGDASSNGFITFNAKVQLNRAGLLLSAGTIYIAFGSHGDCNSDSYHGWVFGYDANTFSQVGVFITTPTGEQGGIWQAGRGPVADQAGNVYLMTGNGHVASNSEGFRTDFSESFVRLDRMVRPVDWWTIDNHPCYNSRDLDLGSSGPLLLNSSTGDLAKNTIIGGGKNGNFYLLNTMNLGHEGPSVEHFIATMEPHFIGAYCATGTYPDQASHIHGGPVLWDQSAYGGTTLIYNMGEEQPLKAFRVVEGTDGVKRIDPTLPYAISKFKAPAFTNHYVWSTSSMPGGTLSLSHSAQTNSGLVWNLLPFKDDANSQVVEGMLSVFDAAPAPCVAGGCLTAKGFPADDCKLIALFIPPSVSGCGGPNMLDLRLLWHSKMDSRDDVGLYAKFTPATIADGRAYVPSFGDSNTCGPYPKHTLDPNCYHPSWLIVYGQMNPPRDLWHWVDLSYVAQGAPKGVPDAAGNPFGYMFNAQGTQHVIYRGTNNRLNELYWDNQGWHWVDLSFVAQGAPKGVPDAASDLFGYAFEAQGIQHIFYRSGNNRLNELYWDNQGWHWVDLSYVAQGAPHGVPDAAGNPFGYVFNAQGTQHVVYRGTNNRLNELYWDNQGWHWVDLSFVAQGAPPGGRVPDAASDLFGYAFEAQGTQHIFYRSGNNRLNELYWDNQGWHWVDLSYVAQGAPHGVPDAAGNLFGYVFNAQGTQHVVYRGTNNRLNELYWDNQGWHWVDLSYVAQGAPPGTSVPDAASDLFGYVFEAQKTQHIFYRSSNNRLNNLYWDNQGWHWVDVSLMASAPDVAGNLFGYVFKAQGTLHVMYRGINNRLNELWWP